MMTPEREEDIRLYLERPNATFDCFEASVGPELLAEIDELRAEVSRYKRDYENACQTVAAMHAVAVGEVKGPNRGVIEDIEDLKKERDRYREAMEKAIKVEFMWRRSSEILQEALDG